jgi:molybdopterin-binding protein
MWHCLIPINLPFRTIRDTLGLRSTREVAVDIGNSNKILNANITLGTARELDVERGLQLKAIFYGAQVILACDWSQISHLPIVVLLSAHSAVK